MTLISTAHSPALERGWEAVSCGLALPESVSSWCHAGRWLVVAQGWGSLLAPASLASLTGGCSAGDFHGKMSKPLKKRVTGAQLSPGS